MARARNIKPGFYKNEDLAECSIWARFIFPGLWMLADREGRLEDRPKRIKGELLPYDGEDVELLLEELSQRGFITRYDIDGKGFIQINAFSKHQTPHVREQASTIPEPPDCEQGTTLVMPDTNLGNVMPSPRSPDSLNPSTLNPSTLNPEEKPSSATDVAVPDEKQIYSKAFIVFWELYPNRVNKGAAAKAFQKIRAAEYPAIRAGLERKKQSQSWLKDNGKFIPHAATWLNARGWEDEDALPDGAGGNSMDAFMRRVGAIPA